MKSLIVWAAILGGVGYGASKLYLHNEVEDAMELAVLMMSPYADVEYSGVRSTVSGELTIENLRIALHEFSDDIEIDRLGIDTPSFLHLINLRDLVSMQGNGIPDTFGFLVEGFRVPTDADYLDSFYDLNATARGIDVDADKGETCTGKYGFSPESLAALGYDEQVFSMAVDVSNSNGRFSLDIDSRIENMWDVNANITLAGDLMSELSKGASYRPRFSEMSIDYTDHSLNDRVRTYCQQLGLTDEEILQAQLDAFQHYGESNGIVFDEYLLDPYVEFLNGKRNITITAKPNEPLAMSQLDLYKASDVPALLNLEAKAY